MKMQSKLAFSVVIPLYNKRAHIQRTLQSVLNQAQRDYEIVIVDDGSTDGGVTLIQQTFAEQIENDTIRIFRQVNAGVSAARNRGVEESEGEVIAFLDADDTWEPNYLAEIANLRGAFPEAGAFTTGYQMVFNVSEFVDPKIRFRKPHPSAGILDDYFDVGSRGALPFMMSSFCIRKALFKEIGKFPLGEAMGEDQDLFCKTALAAPIAYSPHVLSFYHQDTDNRACLQIVPDCECPFSRRLAIAAKAQRHSESYESMVNYSAAHLLHLASLNVRAGRYEAAKDILKDTRCKRQPLRYAWWRLRSELGTSLVSRSEKYGSAMRV